MSARVFFDTNIVVYAFYEVGQPTQVAEQLLVQGGVVSIQVLNEFVSVARRKLKADWKEIDEWIDDLLIFCPAPRPLVLDTQQQAMRICARYGFSIYDGLILAAALEAGCTTLYTEDMQHGQVVEGVRIENPFLGLTAP